MIAAVTDVARDDRTIRALLARLAPTALEQLAAEVARLSERADALAAELDDARRATAYAEDDAEYWRRSFQGLEDQLSDDGRTLGMTQSGEFVVLPPSPAPAGEFSPTQELPMRFQKLDANGARMPDDATDHVAVLDTYPHPDGLYRVWTVADLGELPFAEAEKAAAAVALLGGDWRLPTRMELFSLVDETRCRPAIDESVFPGTQSDYYWTSSPCAGSPDGDAWIVSFGYGSSHNYRRRSYAFVRAVRAVSPGQCSALGLGQG